MKNKKQNWVYTIFFITFILSMMFGVISNSVINSLNIFLAILILILIIIIGILFDIIGVAIASSDISPFTAKASKKHKGAKEAIFLLKNASKVANVCNDVIGDVCGIISGAAGAVIAIRLSNNFHIDIFLLSLIVGSFIASITVFGKALGKNFAMDNSTNIIYRVGIVIHPILKKMIKNKKNTKKN
jgi:CBS domain containing-hemolysin-like protein